MSAQPTAPNIAPDLVNIEIDGVAMQVPKNSMIIAAADKAGIVIPRFCYHEKLPIAANCRMCMVETEMGGKAMPKPQPACATPVMEGMKIFTQSQRALSAQRNVMEFLLINHPLDCPICDQGGECELQDLAMGYGRSVSRFVERKRVVADENIGPLISTDMTRCIQCTRCVRFVSEIAGTYELGGMGRGEHLEIGTYIGKTIESELSGNIIDVCPVGALTNKVFRFKARAWELIARESIGYHDALGSNLYLHTRRGEVLRSVPRDNEAINECWLSDRDRYSHQGLYAQDRATQPLLRKNGALVAVSWDEALGAVAAQFTQTHADQIGALVHPATSSEEGYLLAQLLGGLGVYNIDYRLRQLDFVDGAAAAIFELPVAQIEKVNAALLIGSHLRHELPLVNHRLRKAWKHGAAIYALNPVAFDSNIDFKQQTLAAPHKLLDELLLLAKAAAEAGETPQSQLLADALAAVDTTDAARATVKALRDGGSSVIIFGEVAAQHAQASWLRAAAKFLAKATNSAFNEIASGANAVGLSRVGVLPQGEGLDARTQLGKPRQTYILYGCEPPDDFADGAQTAFALRNAKSVIAFSAFASDALKEIASIILPIGALPEIDATLVNLDGVVQTIGAGAKLPGEARAGWRVLRALGGVLQAPGFAFTEIAEVRQNMQPLLSAAARAPTGHLDVQTAKPIGLTRIATVPIYRADAVLRRSPGLQAHPLNESARIVLHPEDALAAGLAQGAKVQVSGGTSRVSLPLEISTDVAVGGAWIELAHAETATLPPNGATLAVTRV